MRRLLFGGIVGAVGLAVAAGIGFFLVYSDFTRPGPLRQEAVVVIPRGLGLMQIARRLEDAGIVHHALMFMVAARYTGTDRRLRAGEYRFSAGMSGQDVVQLLVSGDTVKRRLTLAEGLTSTEVLALVAGAEALEGDVTERPGEGRLLPETYFYSYGDSRDGLVERMRRAMDAVLAELWAGRAEDLPFATPQEALILASIVEKETAVPAERRRVAAVFINRLRRGMRLQADPTVAYGLTGGNGPLTRGLSRADLQLPTPYNTYLNHGLPPGPIANPGRESVAAVLNPMQTRELYFVADGNGGHLFAETLAEHNRNVARWRQLQRQRARQPAAAE